MTSIPVQVFIRVRPTEEYSESIKVLSNNQIVIPNPRNNTENITYTFNKVFKQDTEQREIWKHCKLIIASCFEGKNCSVFAYGQTGSGKTHTMLKDEGIVQSTISELLQHKSVSISASYLEIYNEKIFDLLSDSQTFLELRQNGSEISLTGCTVVDVSSLDDFNRQLGLALKNRSTASTLLNHQSSRSHFILQLQVSTFENAKKPVTSKIHLIDLAGSEDNKRTNNSGARMEESCAINKSLFVLGQVVEALNKNLPRIPYRDSKITRFLQDSLGGNSQTLLIACISPHINNLYDTYNTLNFATKSSLIKNVVSVNEFQSVKATVESSVERLDALKAWKKSKNALSINTSHNSLKPNSQVKSSDQAQELAEKLENELSLKLSKKVELTIEQRVNARIKEIAENLMSTSTFQKAVSDKFAEVHLKIDSKLKDINSSNDKENIRRNHHTPEKSISIQKPELITIDSPDLEELKAVTRDKILHIINRGNVKAIMTLKTIGKKRAEAILEAREQHGLYEKLENLCLAGLKETQIQALFKANLEGF